MNRGRIVSIASIFTPVVIGLTVGLAAQSAGAAGGARGEATGRSAAHAATTALTVSTAAPQFVLLGCDNNAEVAPSRITNCGDGAAGP